MLPSLTRPARAFLIAVTRSVTAEVPDEAADAATGPSVAPTPSPARPRTPASTSPEARVDFMLSPFATEPTVGAVDLSSGDQAAKGLCLTCDSAVKGSAVPVLQDAIRSDC